MPMYQVISLGYISLYQVIDKNITSYLRLFVVVYKLVISCT